MKNWTAKFNLRRFENFGHMLFGRALMTIFVWICMPLIHLCSHFDGVRALAWAGSDLSLLSASEDHTIKLWHIPLGVKR